MSLHHSAITLLDQLEEVVQQLSDEQFGEPIGVLSQASIGQHVRHSLEFFICLIRARDTGVINYDLRQHDPYIEQDTNLARSIIKSLTEFLQEEVNDCPIKLEANYETDGQDTIAVSSTFFRELAYNIEHTIHHMALIKIGIRSAHSHVPIPDYFGVASSTVRFNKEKRS